MNEELKILIKAVTTEAKKNLDQVKKELKDIDKQSTESGRALDKAMKSAAKGAAVAMASVTALTAAMANLGKSAQEVQKGFEKLNTTFTGAGYTGKQAAQTYKELFSFLGEHDKAIETAQSLALITSEEKDLTEWTQILKGAWAEMGDKLPIEGLAEAANETINVGKVVGVMADALTWAGISEDGFNQALANTTSLEEREVIVRNTLNGLYGNAAKLYDSTNKATLNYNTAQANLNITLGKLAQYLTPLLTSIISLGNILLTALAPAIRLVSLYMTAFIQIIIEAIQWVGSFFGLFSSSTERATADVAGYQNAMSAYTDALRRFFDTGSDGADENNKKVKELKRQLMGFDELNVVRNPASDEMDLSGGKKLGNLGPMPVAPNPGDYGLGTIDVDFEKFRADLDEAKEKIQGLLTLAGILGGAFLSWKLTNFIQDAMKAFNIMKTLKGVDLDEVWNSLSEEEKWGVKHAEKLKTQLKTIGGYALTIAGTMLLIKGYTDGWANGVDWGSLITSISGVALVVGGLYLALGPLAASIGLVAGGIALMVLGVKDFINQGPTVQNTILIIGGAIAVAVGLATAGLNVVVAAIIGLVAAVGAFTAALLLEKPAIMSVEEAQNALTDAKIRAEEAENKYINAVDAAEASMKRLEAAEKAANMTGEELYKQVQDGTLDYADMNDAQRELYKAYLDNEKKQADLKASTEELNKAKKAETIASYEHQLALAKESGNYDDFKKSVVDAYKSGKLSAAEARDLIEKSMSEMSDASRKTFMKDLPGDIKNGLDPSKYESTGTKIKRWFSNMFDAIGKGASKIGDAISKTISSAINWLLKKAVDTINGFINGINWALGIINKIPGVNISKLSLLDVPKLATGGITTGATMAMIGERGKEAVLPLENNTGWMDMLADRIAARSQTASKIVLQVGEKELGWAAIHSINDITKQTGGLQLHIV